ncbi:pre-mRNA-splicing factor 18-like [Condylostylus longicornis]|uniref:pre-mRNA-splicing factor 18-like n=1 Tax=Condylostylus longicornis TaxID=2530218 RepID=UPI00244DDC90|nr:pre-mRNA-splicing factor 18-like [Condylostylus longicornis]
MDVLSALVQQKKKDVEDLKKGGKKWISQKDIKEKERQNALKAIEEADEKRREQELKRLKELEDHLSRSKRAPSGDSNNNLIEEQTPSKRQKAEEHEEGKPPLARDEVIQRLRKRGHVVTYYGESDWRRYKRLCELEIAEHGDELAGGQQNIFLRLLEDQSLSSKDPHHHGGRRRLSDAEAHGFDEDFDDEDDKKEKEEKEPKAQTKEEHVRGWIRKMLGEWETELKQRTEEERSAQLGKIKTAQCKQTRKDLRPLMKKLKHKEEYRSAHDKYIELSIGNAAWPMGVTMVGIHERAGRSKIFTSEIAHILNDETTRKYIHMFKRLISFCQRQYPTDPSQMVCISTVHI